MTGSVSRSSSSLALQQVQRHGGLTIVALLHNCYTALTVHPVRCGASEVPTYLLHIVLLPQLDGFGHSRTEPLLKSMGGFDALFFGRCARVQIML